MQPDKGIRVKVVGRAAIIAAVLGLPLWMSACSHVPDAVNPVAWYRAASGSADSDHKDDQARNQQNLDAGSNKPYPNLASVPDAPDHALSATDRDKLQESLIADRNNAKYSGAQLEAGQPAPLATAAQPSTQADSQANAAPVAPVQTSSVPAPATPMARNRPAAGQEQPPAESSLQSPVIRSVPQGEAVPPLPPPANIAQSPAPPMRTASTAPVTLTPPAERPAQTSLATHPPNGDGKTMSVSVGDIPFAAGSTALPAANGSLNEIAGLYKQTGGRIRVVGHAEPGASGDAVQQQVSSLDLALDRADAVAQALAQMGVPANQISVEAAPTKVGGNDAPRAEVFMEY